MTKMSKKELISSTKPRYLKANKKEKTKILEEFVKNTNYNRKYAITIMKAGYDHLKVEKVGRKQRKPKYDNDVICAAIKVWELLDFPCGVRLQPNLLPTICAMERFNEIEVSSEIKMKLTEISAKTLDRRLKKERESRHLDRHRGTTKHGSMLKSQIPVRITDWDTSELGFMEMDTVAHNGGDPSGTFVYSLDMVEICSGWSEQYAIYGKGEIETQAAVSDIRQGLPFELFGLDSDSGGEFVNYHMLRYCQKEPSLYFTRSRPGKKNDNAYVEQKNGSHIRDLLGFERFDTRAHVEAMNDLYRNELRLFNNFFKPVMKIESKEKVNNSLCRKKYDKAKTPYLRLMECEDVPAEKKKELEALYLSLNPVQLKREIERKVKLIKNL